jgi:Vacuolar protein 14 C-terminal Fig4p binding
MACDASFEGTEKGTIGGLVHRAQLAGSLADVAGHRYQILSMDDGTFPALLKTLSDPSEEVVKSDLQLLAQISSSSEEENFTSFMVNLLSLFSTDRRLLETRGSLIIRQLCLSLNTERIYRTFAEILEKDEVCEPVSNRHGFCVRVRILHV